ncbi:hypothetical protein NDU88_004607 [Pleurodeles waltl]|uniref:Uncharacterized protein n=1 Tax=Pleurodeles waltl TaxID=8319 RepID=A0AAV7SJF1_PLEWA|nr:hypothetical protein NDU88_004607 [Pleurodeles waltl]
MTAATVTARWYLVMRGCISQLSVSGVPELRGATVGSCVGHCFAASGGLLHMFLTAGSTCCFSNTDSKGNAKLIPASPMEDDETGGVPLCSDPAGQVKVVEEKGNVRPDDPQCTGSVARLKRRCRRRRKTGSRRPNRVRQRRRRRRHRGRRPQRRRGRRALRGASRSPPPSVLALLRPVNLYGHRAPGMRAPRNTTQFLMHQVYQDMNKSRRQEKQEKQKKEQPPARIPGRSDLLDEEDRLLWLQCLGEAMHEIQGAATLLQLVKSLKSEDWATLCPWLTGKEICKPMDTESDIDQDSDVEKKTQGADELYSDS